MKINVTIPQLIKFGSYIGNSSSRLEYSNIPYISGIKNDIAYIDPEQCFIGLRRLSYINKKICSKNEGIYTINNSRKDRYIQSLKIYLNKTNINNTKNIGYFKSGIVSNKEIRKSFSFKKKKTVRNVCSRNTNFFFKDIVNRKFVKQEDQKNYKTNLFPGFMNILKYDRNLIQEFRKARILSSCLLDTHNFHHATDYNLLYNNKSVSSNAFLVKILKN